MVVLSKVISFKNVNLKFGGVQALKDVSFDIEENSLFAIIGPNGAGKTSILNCINGIYKSTSGSIDIFDKDIINLQPDEIGNIELSIPIVEKSKKQSKKDLIFLLLLITYIFTFFILRKFKI